MSKKFSAFNDKHIQEKMTKLKKKIVSKCGRGKDFFGGKIVNFSRDSQKDISREVKSGEISFYPLETKKTFFAENVIRKCPISKSRGTKVLLPRSVASGSNISFKIDVCFAPKLHRACSSLETTNGF